MNNFRELSGLESIDEYRTKRNKLYRSSSIHKFNDEELKYLKNIKLDYFIDLRSKEEVEANSYKVEGIGYLHLPFIREYNSIEDFFYKEKMEAAITSEEILDVSKVIHDAYKTMPFHPMLKEVFELMKEGKTILFHCSAGKDRTGVIVAIVLKLLGIREKYILEDYLLSNKGRKERLLIRAKAKNYNEKQTTAFLKSNMVSEELLDSMYESIINKYQSFSEYYMKEFGLSYEDIELIKSNYLER